MRLVVHNQEIRSYRVPLPEVQVFRIVCQLIGVPYREDELAGLFAVFPPLAGKRILIELDEGSDFLLREIEILARSLRLCGADVTLKEVGPASPRHAGDWDVCLIVCGGPPTGGRIEPAVVYLWRLFPWRDRRLASEVVAACRGLVSTNARPRSTRGLPRELKIWARRLGLSGVPGIMIWVPAMNGYGQMLAEQLPFVVSQGVLRYFGAPQLDSALKDAFLQSKKSVTVPTEPTTESPVMPLTAAPMVPATASRAQGNANPVIPLAKPRSPMSSLRANVASHQAEEDEELGEYLKYALHHKSQEASQPSEAQGKGQAAPPNVDAGNIREIMALAPEIREELVSKYLSSKGIAPSAELVQEYMEYLKSIAEQLEE